MKKKCQKFFGKYVYLLGEDKYGIKYWMEEATWNCNWYYGGGYVETYTKNINPEYAIDINSHQHFDELFLNNSNCAFDNFKKFFTETPFSDSEIWKIVELMNSFYIAKNYSDMLHRGGTNYTSNPTKDTIKNDSEYNRINKEVIPKIMNELYKILKP